eukprot:2450108-Lingulodinium_polyedra.AAC.1
MRSRHPQPLHLNDEPPNAGWPPNAGRGITRALHGWRAPDSPRATLLGKNDLDARPPWRKNDYARTPAKTDKQMSPENEHGTLEHKNNDRSRTRPRSNARTQ